MLRYIALPHSTLAPHPAAPATNPCPSPSCPPSTLSLRRPVLIFGEPGLEKDNVAALIHFGSPDHKSPMVRIDCERCVGWGGVGRQVCVCVCVCEGCC